jgi:hypothetical protein
MSPSMMVGTEIGELNSSLVAPDGSDSSIILGLPVILGDW